MNQNEFDDLAISGTRRDWDEEAGMLHAVAEVLLDDKRAAAVLCRRLVNRIREALNATKGD